jgi:hypothetical protein
MILIIGLNRGYKMAQKHDILFIEKPMTVGTHEQGPQKRYRRLRFPSFDSVVWTEKNPLLQKGELGHEKDTGRFKVGDGVTYWSDLPYNSVGDPAKVNGYNVLEIVAGKNVEIEQSGNVLTIGASGVGYSKAEIDNKFIVANAQIDANATAIQKTRNDYIQADSEIHQMINAQAAAIEKKQDELTAGDNIIISGNVISATGAGGGVGFDVIVVQELPESGEKGIIYLVPKDSAAPDVYDEYVWVTTTSTFELIGSTRVDLTGYATKEDLNAVLPDQTGNAGKFLKTDGSEASWGETLPYTEYSSDSIVAGFTKSGYMFRTTAFGKNIAISGNNVANITVFGSGVQNVKAGTVAFGGNIYVGGADNIIIGSAKMSAGVSSCIIIGKRNPDVSFGESKSVIFATYDKDFKLLDLTDGTIPAERMSATAGVTGQVLTKTDTGMGWSEMPGLIIRRL